VVRKLLRDSLRKWSPASVAVIAFAVYVATLAPDLSFAHHGTDGGDLIAAARTLGIPHPPGYPTYTLLAWLFSHLPFGTIAYRVNLLSAVCAAATVGLLCCTAEILQPANDPTPGRPGLPAATALTLAFSSLLWSQAVISEVYTLLALFAALLLWLLVRWRRGGGDHLLWLTALLGGLGLGNHLTLVLIVPAALILLWPERRRWLRTRALLPAGGLFLTGLCVYVYLPLAAAHSPPVNWGNPQTWSRFLWVVTAKQYQGFAFGLDLAAIPGRLSAWAQLLGDQFGWWGLAIALAGLWSLWQRDRRFALFSLAWILPAGTYAFFYDTGDSEVYLLPALLLLALWWGEGASYLLQVAQHLRPARRMWQRSALFVVLLLPLASLALHWQAASPDDDWLARSYIDQALESVEPGGLIISRGDRPTFALWYGLFADGQRPDVAIVNGPLLAYFWYRDEMRRLYPDLTLDEPAAADTTIDDLVRNLILSNLSSRPIYSTDPGEAWKDWFDLVATGEAPIYRVYLKSSEQDEPRSFAIRRLHPFKLAPPAVQPIHVLADLTAHRAGEGQIPGVSDHPVGGAQAVRHRLVGPDQDLFHLDVGEGLLPLQTCDQFGDLVRRRQDGAKEAAIFQALDHLGQVQPGLAYIQEHSIRVALVKAIGNVPQLEFDVTTQSQHFQIFLRQAQDIGSDLVRV
jgi:hypothetical protein